MIGKKKLYLYSVVATFMALYKAMFKTIESVIKIER